jgi:hypothetical protein
MCFVVHQLSYHFLPRKIPMVFPVNIPDFPPFGKDTVFLGTKKRGVEESAVEFHRVWVIIYHEMW